MEESSLQQRDVTSLTNHVVGKQVTHKKPKQRAPHIVCEFAASQE